MDLSIYFSAIEHQEDAFFKEQIGGQVVAYNENTGFPEIDDSELVIIGVEEDRGSVVNEGCAKAPNFIREKLFGLFMQQMPKTVDLGNISAGENIEDTYYALESSIDYLIKRNKTVIVLGGSHDLTLSLYKGYENTEQLVNLTTIDPLFDIGNASNSPLNSETYLSHLLLHQPNYLFNYSNIGYQTYFSSPDILGLIDKLFFDKIRLGEVRKNIRGCEPIIRNSDIVSVDMSAVQAADMVGCARSTPNGLLPDEICQLTRYAGLSEKVSCFGVFEYNPTQDLKGNSALLTAQAIWYFIEGYGQRRNEAPLAGDPKYIRYRVPVTGADEDVIFFKSLRTDRWWMVVPYPDAKSNKYNRLNMVPCSYQDYLEAGQDELPDLWVRTYRKFL